MPRARFSRRTFTALASIVAIASLHDGSPLRSSKPAEDAAPRAPSAKTDARFGKLPLRFEENVGQFTDGVSFVAIRGRARLALRGDGAELSVRSSRPNEADERETTLSFTVAGGRKVAPEASAKLETKTNYFLGNDPAKWRTDVANYARVTYRDVLDGVDLVYHGEEGQMEYDFIVKPGAKPAAVAMNVGGAKDLSIAESGDLVVHTPDGDFVQPAPRVYQHDAAGREIEVKARYRVVGERSIGFEVASYDTTKDLVIDPVIGYASYLGGAGTETINGVAVDKDGAAYVTGVATLGTVTATALKFPTTAGAFQANHDAENNTTNVNDAFVAKFKADGSGLVYATYVGGTGADVARSIAVDADGQALIGGSTVASNFPTANTGIQLTRPDSAASTDGFVVKLNAAGSALAFSTYLGTPGQNVVDVVNGVAYDSAGNPYVTGTTNHQDFPTTIGAYDTTRNGQDAFVARLAKDGSALIYSTFLGGTGTEVGNGIVVDGTQPIVVGTTNNNTFPTKGAAQDYSAGTDGFVTKLSADGSALEFSTFIGSSGTDTPRAVAVDKNHAVYVVGESNTLASDPLQLPVTKGNAIQEANAGGTDIFVTKLDAAGANHLYTTWLGGSGNETASGIAVDGDGYATIVGYSSATGYPLRTEASTYKGGNDAVVTRLKPNGGTVAVYSSYLGGTGSDLAYGVALDAAGNAVVVGSTASTFPVTTGAAQTTRYGTDGFIAKLISPSPDLAPNPASVKPKGSQTITATGGSGLEYVFSFKDNKSGGTISTSGAYVAGATGGVTDIVQVKDSENAVGTLDIAVGPAITIAPTAPNVAPKGTLALTATGGSDEGYTWSLSGTPNGSITTDGTYTAPDLAGASDTAVVEDSLHNTASVQISVGGGIAITPATPKSPPRGSLTFAATGGSGKGFVWTLPKTPSGGSITAAGVYKAGTTASVTDTAHVVDDLGNAKDIDIEVGAAVAITPVNPSVNGGGAITFSATGGDGKFTWTLQAAPSNGTIDKASGLYSAGVVTAPVTDIVLATDSLGNTATSLVEVKVASEPEQPSADAGTNMPTNPNDGTASEPAADEGGCSASPARPTTGLFGLVGLLVGLTALVRRRRA